VQTQVVDRKPAPITAQEKKRMDFNAWKSKVTSATFTFRQTASAVEKKHRIDLDLGSGCVAYRRECPLEWGQSLSLSAVAHLPSGLHPGEVISQRLQVGLTDLTTQNPWAQFFQEGLTVDSLCDACWGDCRSEARWYGGSVRILSPTPYRAERGCKKVHDSHENHTGEEYQLLRMPYTLPFEPEKAAPNIDIDLGVAVLDKAKKVRAEAAVKFMSRAEGHMIPLTKVGKFSKKLVKLYEDPAGGEPEREAPAQEEAPETEAELEHELKAEPEQEMKAEPEQEMKAPSPSPAVVRPAAGAELARGRRAARRRRRVRPSMPGVFGALQNLYRTVTGDADEEAAGDRAREEEEQREREQEGRPSAPRFGLGVDTYFLKVKVHSLLAGNNLSVSGAPACTTQDGRGSFECKVTSNSAFQVSSSVHLALNLDLGTRVMVSFMPKSKGLTAAVMQGMLEYWGVKDLDVPACGASVKLFLKERFNWMPPAECGRYEFDWNFPPKLFAMPPLNLIPMFPKLPSTKHKLPYTDMSRAPPVKVTARLRIVQATGEKLLDLEAETGFELAERKDSEDQ